MFRNAKIGDRVWSILDGWGEIVEKDDSHLPITIRFISGNTDIFTLEGKLYPTNKYPALFWDEVKVEKQPQPENKEHYQIAEEIFNNYIINQNIGEGLSTIVSLLLAAIDNSGIRDKALESVFNAIEDYKNDNQNSKY